jgi:hypothetical protein
VTLIYGYFYDIFNAYTNKFTQGERANTMITTP